jgi:hypothetical protein
VEGFDEMPYLAAALSSTANLIEGRVDVATANRVLWGPAGIDRRLVTLP